MPAAGSSARRRRNARSAPPLSGPMSLELLAVTFDQHRDEYVKTREIIEWACERFRRLPASEVERQFQPRRDRAGPGRGRQAIHRWLSKLWKPLHAVSVRTPNTRPNGSRARRRFKLAIATANPEVQQIATWPLPPGYLVYPAPARIEHQYEREIINDSLQVLSELFDDPAVAGEARLRSGVLRFVREDMTVARTDLEHAEQASDPVHSTSCRT